MPAPDLRPTTEAPDDDPYRWLEEVDGAAAIAWVAQRNAETRARFDGPAVARDRDTLAAILDRPDNIPSVIRRHGLLYNLWKDAGHPRGLLRRTTLASFATAQPDWEIVLDIDALAEAEGEDWVFQGSTVEPLHGRRALLRLSRGGSDAATLREFDLVEKRFVPGGFALPAAKGGAGWLDDDTLLISSAIGEGMATTSGYARTVRVWPRGTDWRQARVIFEIPADHMAAWGGIDDDTPDRRLVLVDRTDFINATVFLARGIDAPPQRVDLPSDAWFQWNGHWLAVRRRSDWTLDDTTHPAGTVLGIDQAAFEAGSRRFTVLFRPEPRRTCTDFFWAGGTLVLSVLDDLQPRHLLLTPGPDGWAERTLPGLPGLPSLGVASVWRLDERQAASDGHLLANVQDPLTPPSLLLTDITAPAPTLLKRAPVAFNAAGLAVTRHEAVSADGLRVPYFQIGPQAETGGAPVHMYGYGGFNVAELPTYRAGIGKLWLERGGTSVITCLRGGGEFGPAWHEAGRREGKFLAHEDFAAIAADLVRRGVTRPDRIAAEGGSNGGILITNMLTRHPDKFGGLFCTIPLVDMRRYTKLLAGASWIAEYGDPDIDADWAFLQTISAYHTAAPNPAAPPILLATTRRDDRVHPGHARKMTAKLQAMGYRAWLLELEAGGHSYGKSNRDRAYFTALGYAFLRDAIHWHEAAETPSW
jgi:prolyl oligopeptidase